LEDFLHFLLNDVLIKWVPCFTIEETKSLFDVFFFKSPARLCFLSLASFISTFCALLKTTLDRVKLEKALALLEPFLVQHRMLSVFCEVALNNQRTLDSSWNKILYFIGNFPSRLANLLEGKSPPDLFAEFAFYSSMCSQAFSFLRQCTEKSTTEQQAENSQRLVAEFCSKIVILGHSGEHSFRFLHFFFSSFILSTFGGKRYSRSNDCAVPSRSSHRIKSRKELPLSVLLAFA
jgi:hypothetical protein